MNKGDFDFILEGLVEYMSAMTSEERENLIANLPWCHYCWSDYSVNRNCQCWNDE